MTMIAWKLNDMGSCYRLQDHYSRLKYIFQLLTIIMNHKTATATLTKKKKNPKNPEHHPNTDHYEIKNTYVTKPPQTERQAWQMALLCVHTFFLSIPTNTPLTPPALTTNMAD